MDILSDLNQRHARILDVCEGVESFLMSSPLSSSAATSTTSSSCASEEVQDQHQIVSAEARRAASEHAEGFVTYSCLSEEKQDNISAWNERTIETEFDEWCRNVFGDLRHEVIIMHRAVPQGGTTNTTSHALPVLSSFTASNSPFIHPWRLKNQ